MITFESGVTSPHKENNTVYARYFPATAKPQASGAPAPRRAVVVTAQWNADEAGHVGLCRLLQWFGISALRVTLPYHDRRRPPELQRADYIVSSNMAQTLQVCRQAVVDLRRAVAWLDQQGYERIGLAGTSLGSCLSMLTGMHEPLVKAMVLNHASPYFADVIWEGLSTAHVRAGMEGHIDLPRLRDIWAPISPRSYMHRIANRPTLIVYALYDLSFPLHLSLDIVREYRTLNAQTRVRVMPCGHYTMGVTPFKYIDGLYLARFLQQEL
jgi:pimeloyl-ACP methyl ester carboxylesterase